MRILPILFNTDMVRALLEDRKSVTRRPVKVRFRAGEAGWNIITNAHTGEFCYLEVYDEWEEEVRRLGAPYEPGDILYVRETWSMISEWTNVDPNVGMFDGYIYKADWTDDEHPRWRPSIHMPKEAARIFLRVKSVRVERLQDITEEQAREEGFFIGWKVRRRATVALTARQAFMRFWPPAVWGANPWVWVIEFERTDKPEGWPGP